MNENMDNEEYFVIDTDCGSDDALAIMLAMDYIQNRDIGNKKLLGIVCCSGNTTVDKVARNVQLTLRIMNETKVKVYRGSHCSLLNKYKSYEFFGEDGLGNSVSCYEPVDSKVEEENGVQMLISFVRMYPYKVTILCLGPLTNLALAYLIDNKFFELTKQLYILGGNINAVGNVTLTAEFNFYFDVEAVHITLNNARCPVTIIPWESCTGHCLLWSDYKKLTELDTKKALFFSRITKFIIEKEEYKKAKGIEFADFLVVAVYLNPNLALETKKWNSSIELSGELTRGQLVVDKTKETDSGFEFVTKIDDKILHEMFEAMLRENNNYC